MKTQQNIRNRAPPLHHQSLIVILLGENENEIRNNDPPVFP